MVTTTTVPYIYHVPAILGTPLGVAYWFRYLSRYLHSDLKKLPYDELPKSGILYLRDELSSHKLCYPVRRFDILSFDKGSTFSFINLRMSSRANYGAAMAPKKGDALVPKGLDEPSWHLMRARLEEYRARTDASLEKEPSLPSARPDGVSEEVWQSFVQYVADSRDRNLRPLPRTIAVPPSGNPPIVTWDALKPDEPDALLWVGPEGSYSSNAPDDELERWRTMLAAFSPIEHVNRIPFFFVEAPTSIQSGRAAEPRKIGRGDGLHARGFPVKSVDAYRVQVYQVTPHAFCEDAPTVSPFNLTIAASDSGIRPLVKDVEIDGPYGYYELSFDVDPKRIGTYALLRLSTANLKLPASLSKNAGAVEAPHIVVPVIIERSWTTAILWGVLALGSMLAFVAKDQWMTLIGLNPESTIATLLATFLFGVAIVAANKAGIGDFTGGLGKKL